MILTLNDKNCFRRLPSELLKRLETICLAPEVQDDILCVLHPKGEYAVRWNRPLEVLPYPHRILSDSRTQRILLNVLNEDSKRVLTLQGCRGAWQQKYTCSLYWFAGALKRSGHFVPKGKAPLATTSQMKLIAKLLAMSPDVLPPLSKANAAMVLDAAMMSNYWRRVTLLVQSWKSDDKDAKIFKG